MARLYLNRKTEHARCWRGVPNLGDRPVKSPTVHPGRLPITVTQRV